MLHQVGDPLELRFEIFDESSPYEIFVRDLLAKDGNDQNQIVLLDSQGCPTEGQIMGPLRKDPDNPKILVANFDAFKFPTSQVSREISSRGLRSVSLKIRCQN